MWAVAGTAGTRITAAGPGTTGTSLLCLRRLRARRRHTSRMMPFREMVVARRGLGRGGRGRQGEGEGKSAVRCPYKHDLCVDT